MTLTGLKVSVDGYHRMIADGAFAEDERYELLEETIVRRRWQTPPHCCVRELLSHALRERLPAGWHVRERCGFTTADSEPEPDLVVVAGDIDDYLSRHPGPADAALVVEIVTDQMTDLEVRLRAYARAGVRMLWAIDVDAREVAVYTAPSGPGREPSFGGHQRSAASDVSSLQIAGAATLELSVATLLPPVS